MFKENNFIPINQDEVNEYFIEKYEDEQETTKLNRKKNQRSEEKFMPMDGKFTREYFRIRHERENKK